MKVKELIDLINQPHLLDLAIKIETEYSFCDIKACIIYVDDFISIVPQHVLEFND